MIYIIKKQRIVSGMIAKGIHGYTDTLAKAKGITGALNERAISCIYSYERVVEVKPKESKHD